MLYEVISEKKFEDVCASVENACKNNGFGVMKIYEFKKILEEKGFPIEKEIVVYEICQPKAASKALTITSAIAPFMPCRLAVEKLENGTKVYTFLPSQIVELTQSDEIKDLAQEIDQSIKNIINQIS